jgi:ubiquinone/menaquinone biosynthesis C-methylase UbiE
MSTSHDSELPHSAEYFGDYRDFWWNHDFLQLMARRLGLSKVQSVLDIGCGIGHWGQIVASVAPSTCQFIGLDREAESVSKATARASELGLGQRFRYQVGDVLEIPFKDASFDMVTCQTVLIHVGDVKKALTEMLRVLKPGGLLLAVEPNNLM